MPDVFVEDGSGGELGDFGDFGILGLGTDAIAFPKRDLGLLLALTFPPSLLEQIVSVSTLGSMRL
ncbi:hypothetical protein N9793_00800 [bacterium]|nr:hypothetical protein [bacterium]